MNIFKIKHEIIDIYCRSKDISLGVKYFFEDLLHPLVRKLFLHLKEAALHLQ